MLVSLSFFAAFCAAFCGIGPGTIFCPVLVILDLEPNVATSTGMYLTMLTTISASLQSLVFKSLPVNYAAIIQSITFFGSVPGIYY